MTEVRPRRDYLLVTTTSKTQIDQAIEKADFGTASARKSGRNQRWPYVPVLLWLNDVGEQHQTQLQGFAYETRDEAVAHVERYIVKQRESLRRLLSLPTHRALREHHGLPREIDDVR